MYIRKGAEHLLHDSTDLQIGNPEGFCFVDLRVVDEEVELLFVLFEELLCKLVDRKQVLVHEETFQLQPFGSD